MSWQDEYQRKKLTVDEAVGLVVSDTRIYVSGNAATPQVFLEALGRRTDVEGVEVVHVLQLGEDPLTRPENQKRFRHNSLFVGPADRRAVNAGESDYIPIFLHQIPEVFQQGRLPLDIAFIQVSPPDQHGHMSFGVEVLASKSACAAAALVVAQVNWRMPRVLGDSFIHVSEVDHVVEMSHELPELPVSDPSPLEVRIAGHVAALIPDGATLQLGIGGIPDAVLRSLEGKKNLGVHTEMVSDGVMRAYQAGLLTGARKSIHPGKVVATFILGTRELYDFVNDNPAFELHPVRYTNDPFVIAQNTDMVAINSAIEVDFTGQVCSDSIGTYIYSGFGGQVDFIRGAARAKNGKPIIALPSTAKGGEVSRIVPVLKEGAGVVTTRADVHYVVTEHGVADLFGKNLRQRAEALVEVAHPDHRSDLRAAARSRKLVWMGPETVLA
ncbi:MAG: acetyl-CoA hydrolase/transferase C-terminal domain-containing protein [Longimicrobiales bacterium]|nr:acetyl-CoA hydrolase/transferase C-terminal domain-containing protein [Longimicrobiales bacterium]